MAVRIRIAGYQGEPSVQTRAMRLLIAALRAKAAEPPDVDFVPNIAERGYKAADLLSLVATGELDLCYFSSSYLTDRVPALGALEIPFALTDRNALRARLDGSLGALLRQEIAVRTAHQVLAYWDNGLRQISNRRRAIDTPEDCAGLTIRTLPSVPHRATFRALGMEPVTIDVADMVQAIADGKVDAQENPLTNIRLFGLQRYHRFVTMTGHVQGIALLLCNAQSLASWPEDIRRALDAAVTESTIAQWTLAAEDETASRAALTAEGVRIVDLDEAARGQFKEAVRGVIAQAHAALPPELARCLGDDAR